MKKHAIAVSEIIFLSLLALTTIFVSTTLASENINVKFYQTDIGDVNRYWYGQGEMYATVPENLFELYKNRNEIVSCATDATLVDNSEEKLKFVSDKEENKIHVLFISSRPEGHGLFTLEFSTPYVFEKEEKNVTLIIENAERILYLNGPVFLEGENIHSEGNLKFIKLETPDNDIKVIFVTKLAYSIFSSLIGISVFGFVLLVLISFRREKITKKIKKKLQKFGTNSPISISEAENGIEFRFKRKNFSSNLKSVGEDDAKKTLSIKISREIVAGILVLMLSYIIFKSIIAMVSSYVAEMGSITYLILGMLAALGLIMFVLLLCIETAEELNVTISVFAGGIMLVIFSKLGILMIPIAILAALIVYVLGKAFFIGIESLEGEDYK